MSRKRTSCEAHRSHENCLESNKAIRIPTDTPTKLNRLTSHDYKHDGINDQNLMNHQH